MVIYLRRNVKKKMIAIAIKKMIGEPGARRTGALTKGYAPGVLYGEVEK
jgi:hypothetical protein